MKSTKQAFVYVWDLFIRFFHWSLVIAVSVTAYTGFITRATTISIHIWVGTVAGILLLARIYWGLWGSPNARFRNFVKGPRETLEHLKEVREGTAHRHLGHNPLGALMILALITTILLLVLTGTIGLGGVFKVGPLGFATSYQFGTLTLSLHKLLAIWLLVLVGLHIAGAVFEGFRTRENLVKSMVTGKKESRDGDHIVTGSSARPLAVVVLFVASVSGIVWGGASLASRPAPDLPPAGETAFDPTYADECSACHIAYNPSLMSANSWKMLMGGLSDHFGEDASLDPTTVDALTKWLVANAADTVDTKPAHVLSQMAQNAPYTITSTPFWKTTHAGIPPETFKRAPIYDNGNCTACHSDAAAGRFYPANISIPKEKQK